MNFGRVRAALRRLVLDAMTALILTVSVDGAVHAGALPQGPQVISGTVQVQSSSPTTLNITQTTNRAAIDWQSFSIGNGNTVDIQQPNAKSIQLDQVVGNNVSQIFGDLNSNGRVILANPSGVWFGPNSHVNVSGIVATTSTASAADMAAFGAGGKLNLSQQGNANASIVNQGAITVSQAGLAAFVAPTVANNGTITAKLGTVQLSSGSAPTLDFYGDGLISLAVTGQAPAPSAPSSTAAVQNTGTISASGGTVVLSANAAAGVVNQVINSSGVIEAKSVGQRNGQIVLNGGTNGTVTVSGTLDASSLGKGQTGGTVKVLGSNVQLANGANVNVSGNAGGGNVMIGGDFHGAGPDMNAATTTVAMGATIKADAVASGDGGNVAVWSDQSTSFDGAISAMGGLRGKGGFVETSGHYLDVGDNATVDTLAVQGTAGTWLLDPTNITVNSCTSGCSSLASVSSFSTGAGNTDSINATAIQAGLASGNVTLEAGNDITISSAITAGTGQTHSLTLDAGRNVNVNANITLNGGSFTATANDTDANQSTSNGGDQRDRGPGAGSFVMASGTTIDVSAGTNASVTINIDATQTNGHSGSNAYTAGSVTLAGIKTGSSGSFTVAGSDTGITQAGTTDNLIVGGTSSFTSTGTVALTNSGNKLTSAVTLDTTGTGSDVSLTNDVATSLATSNISGSLTVDDKVGNLTQTGVLTVGGTASFTTDASNATITLNTQTNQLTGAVTLATIGNSGNASLKNGKATLLAASNVGGNLSVEDTIGNLTENGVLTVGGTSSFTTDASNADITLTSTNQLTGAVTLTTTGAAGNASLKNGKATLLAASTVGGNLSVEDTSGNLSENGVLTVGGTSSFKTDTSNAGITLTSTNQLTGAVTLATTGSTGNASLTNGVDTAIAAATNVGGTLTVATGANDLTLNGFTVGGLSVSTTGLETLNAGTYNIDSGSGTYTVSSTGGLDLDGTITLDNATVFSSPVTLTGATSLSTASNKNITFNNSVQGTTDSLTLNAGTGTISASGSVDVGSFILNGGNWSQNTASLPSFAVTTDFEINGGSFLRVAGGSGTSGSPYQITDIYGLQGIGSTSALRGASYQLANDVDASGTATWNSNEGFVPIGTTGSSSHFTGTFDGQSFTITGLKINTSSSDYVGLFGYSTGTIENVGLVNGSVSGDDRVGALAGYNNGTITNSYASGTAVSGNQYVGGLVGYNDAGGSINETYATGAVSGNGSTEIVGGLVGYNLGSIQQSYATGNVRGGGGGNFISGDYDYIGGLVGENAASGSNAGAITYAYATGSVTDSGSEVDVGGLVGFNDHNGSHRATITQAYATGAVSATGSFVFNQNQGGLVGVNNSGTINFGYYDSDTTGQSHGTQGDGSIGEHTATLQGPTLPNGFDNTVWGTASGKYPFFLWQAPSVPPVIISGVLYSDFGVTPLGSGITVDIISGGVLLMAVTSTAGGDYTASVASSNVKNDSVLAYIASGSTKGSTFTDSGTYTDLDIWSGTTRLVTGDTKLSAVLGNLNTTLSGYNDASGFLGLTASATSLAATKGGILLNSPATFTIDGSLTASGQITIKSGGDIDLSSGTLSSSATGDAVVLAATGAFDNTDGSSALSASNGRWLVFSSSPTATNEAFDGLNSGNTAVWDTTYPATISATGNRYVFAFQPTIAVSVSGNESKTYGQDATAAVAGDYTVSGLQSGVSGAFLGDTAASVYSGTPSITSAGSGPTADVHGGPYAIVAAAGSFTVGDGYALGSIGNPSNYTITVNPAQLTVTADDKSMQYGASSLPTLTDTITGFVPGENASVVSGVASLSTTATAYNGTAHSGSDVGNYAILAGQGSLAASNYTFTFVNGSLTVTPAALTVTANSQQKNYGTNDPTLTYQVGGLANGDAATDALAGNLARAQYGTLAGEQVGSYGIIQGTLTIPTNSNGLQNYTLAYNSANLTINPAALTVAADARQKTYGTDDPALTYQVGGLVNTTVDGVAISDQPSNVIAGNLARAEYGTLGGEQVGNYAITVGSLALTGIGAGTGSNYSFDPTGGFTGGTLTINPATLNVTANSGQSKIYGTPDPAFAFTATGFVNTTVDGGVAISDSAGNVLTGALARDPGVNVGSYAINQGSLSVVPNANSLANYNISYTGANFAIDPAALVITASNASSTYGQAPTLTYSETGLVAGDSIDTVTLTSPGTAARSNVGNYTITASSATGTSGSPGVSLATNYDITYHTGTLSIGKATLTITADDITKTYGQTATLTYFETGLVSGDTISSVGLSSSGASNTANVSSSPYTISASNAAGSSGPSANRKSLSTNYTIDYVGGSLTVNPATLTVKPDAVSTTYSGVALPAANYSDDTSNYTITGFVNGQHANSAGVDLNLSGSMAFNGSTTTVVENVGTYTQTQGTLALSSGHNNYVMSFVNPTPNNYVITPKSLTVTANSGNKTYDTTAFSGNFGVSFNGFVAGQNSSVLGGTLAYGGTAQGAIDVGNYTIVPSGYTSSNYAITFRNGTLTVNPAALTVTGTRLYDSDNDAPFSILTLNGLLGADQDTVTLASGSGSLISSDVHLSGGVPQPVSLSSAGSLKLTGTNSQDYKIVTSGSSVTIDPLPVVLSGTRQYDGTDGANGSILTITNAYRGDDVRLTGLGTLAGSDASTTPYLFTSTGSLALTGRQASDYTLQSVTIGATTYQGVTSNASAVTITPAILSIAGEKTYDGTAAFLNGSIDDLTVNSPVAGETLTLTGVVNSSSPNASTYNGVGLNSGGNSLAILVNGGTSGISNYQLPNTATLKIDPAVISISGSKAYDGNGTFGVGNLTVSGAVDNETITLASGTSVSTFCLFCAPPSNVGSYTGFTGTPSFSVAAGTSSSNKNPVAGNYVFNSFLGIISVPLAINPAQLSIAIVGDPTKYYDSTDAAFLASSNYSLTGFVSGQGATVNQTAGTYATANASAPDLVTASLSAGNYTANKGTLLSNYTLPTSASGNGTVSPAQVTLNAVTDTKSYDGTTNSTGTPTYQVTTFNANLGQSQLAANALYGTDSLTGLGQSFNSPNVVGATTLSVNSGYVFNPSGNYAVTTINTAAGTISPAALTITANDESKIYDGKAFPFAGTEFTTNVGGLQNGETIASVTLTTSPDNPAINRGTYSIAPSDPVAGAGTNGTTFIGSNYAITYNTGTLTIDPAALKITADNQGKTYGDTFTFQGTEFTTSGLVTGDSVTSATITSAGAAGTATVVSPGPTYAINIADAVGVGLSNYTITYAPGTMTVNPKTLAISADDVFKLFGTTFTFQGTEFTTSPLVNGDTVTSATLTSAGAVANAIVASYPIDISNAAGSGLGNYFIVYVPGTMTVQTSEQFACEPNCTVPQPANNGSPPIANPNFSFLPNGINPAAGGDPNSINPQAGAQYCADPKSQQCLAWLAELQIFLFGNQFLAGQPQAFNQP